MTNYFFILLLSAIGALATALIIIYAIFKRRLLNVEAKYQKELVELTQKIKKADENLKKLDKTKSEFISIASHQLRTPLSIIKGFVSMLLDGSYGAVPDKAKEILNKIEASNDRLGRLIDDLLDLSRIEDGRMRYKWEFISFATLISSVVEELEPIADKKTLDLNWANLMPEQSLIRADEEKLRQVVINLIDNAIKYTPVGSVTIKLEKTIEGQARLMIKDTDVGITKEDMGVIFGKFVRGKNVPQLWTEGAGLGLFVAKEIIKEHQGKIWAESEEERKGSAFYIELPVY